MQYCFCCWRHLISLQCFKNWWFFWFFCLMCLPRNQCDVAFDLKFTEPSKIWLNTCKENLNEKLKKNTLTHFVLEERLNQTCIQSFLWHIFSCYLILFETVANLCRYRCLAPSLSGLFCELEILCLLIWKCRRLMQGTENGSRFMFFQKNVDGKKPRWISTHGCNSGRYTGRKCMESRCT